MIALAFGASDGDGARRTLDLVRAGGAAFHLYAAVFLQHCMWHIYPAGVRLAWLSYAQPLTSFAWNVPVGLSGAVGCYSPRDRRPQAFFPAYLCDVRLVLDGFVVITVANLAKFLGFGMG